MSGPAVDSGSTIRRCLSPPERWRFREEELGQTIEALRGSSGRHLAVIRSEHMRRLLQRFNQHVTSIPAVPA